jgi:hypothetical protein
MGLMRYKYVLSTPYLRIMYALCGSALRMMIGHIESSSVQGFGIRCSSRFKCPPLYYNAQIG